MSPRSASLGGDPHEADPKPALALNGQTCPVFMSDIVGYGDPARTDADRDIMAKALYDMTETVFDEAAIAWDRCRKDDRGDGMLLIAPSDIPALSLVHPLPRRLADLLRAYNKAAPRAQRMRLRTALAVGPVTEKDNHRLSGETIIKTRRILDADPLRKGVVRSGICLGLIATQFVYDTVIKHEPKVTGFHEVDVEVKLFREKAWLRFYR